nr:MAG TPA: hypothetical protein [Podoviridae sp. ctY3D12]
MFRYSFSSSSHSSSRLFYRFLHCFIYSDIISIYKRSIECMFS